MYNDDHPDLDCFASYFPRKSSFSWSGFFGLLSMPWTRTYRGNKPTAVQVQLAHSMLSAQEKMMCRSSKNKEWKYLGKTLDSFEKGYILFQTAQLTLKNQGGICIVKNGNKITNLKATDPIAKDSIIPNFCLVT